MLFSQDDVANFLNLFFEPTWQSVRPVPLVRIDFGNGNVLTRTLHGNIVSSVCTSEGQVLDALPGLYAASTYRDRLNQLRLLALYLQSKPAGQRMDWLSGYHKRQAEALAKGQTPEQFAVNLATLAITKSVIERPLEMVLLRPSSPTPPPLPETVSPNALAGAEDVARWKALAEDTRLNETTRRRQVHDILAAAKSVNPEALTRRLYKEVLHADLDDPYLGLGDVLFASYPFAREDGDRSGR